MKFAQKTHSRPPADTSRRVVRARRWERRLTRMAPVLTGAVIVVGTGLAFADSAAAATGGHVIAAKSLTQVVEGLRLWLVGILAVLATLFLTIGGLRYLAAGGDPGQVEKAKSALKSAVIGYALALLAPVLITLVAKLVG